MHICLTGLTKSNRYLLCMNRRGAKVRSKIAKIAQSHVWMTGTDGQSRGIETDEDLIHPTEQWERCQIKGKREDCRRRLCIWLDTVTHMYTHTPDRADTTDTGRPKAHCPPTVGPPPPQVETCLRFKSVPPCLRMGKPAVQTAMLAVCSPVTRSHKESGW